MGQVQALVRACHPEPTVAVTAVSAAVATAAGRGGGTAWVAAAVLAGQLSVGWSNDYLDRDRDVRTGRPDKPVSTGRVPARTVGLAALVAAVAMVPLSFGSGPRAGAVHIVAVASAWSYNLRLKATVLSALPYVVSFGLLPGLVTLGLPGHPWPPAWVVLAGALLGAGAHFANVLPDIDDDLLTGIVGLPHRLGAVASSVLSAVLVLAASAVLVVGPRGRVGVGPLLGLVVATALVAYGVADVRRSGSRTAFRMTLVVAALDVVLLVARAPALH
ncbi:MAG: UbiA family prenyltransferase [Actinomycetota bacterium]|nr:UbiA family prenyltransferase [Actinomycetota bacterium]